jgi:hypothetical protein
MTDSASFGLQISRLPQQSPNAKLSPLGNENTGSVTKSEQKSPSSLIYGFSVYRALQSANGIRQGGRRIFSSVCDPNRCFLLKFDWIAARKSLRAHAHY